MEVLGIPHFDQILLVEFRPFADKLPAPFWQCSFDDVQILKLHDGHVLGVFDMDVARRMLPADEEHANNDPVKAADLRHLDQPCLTSSRPV